MSAVTIDTVADHLRHVGDFIATAHGARHDDWAYATYEHLVLAEGHEFERKPLPTQFRKMREKMCYQNAYHCVTRDYDDQYLYVEGYARGIIVVEHAFVLDLEDGKIFDPTWPRDNDHDGGYYGIVFPTQYMIETTSRTGCYGLLGNDWMDDHNLLRNGRSEWEHYPLPDWPTA